MNLIEIHFDGGCRPTNPGHKYGSYQVLLNSKPVFGAYKIELGYGTNNEAEFDILIHALKSTSDNLRLGGFDQRNYSADLFTDSTVVLHRIQSIHGKGKNEAAKRMAALTKICLSYLGQYKLFKIHWNKHDANLARFGH